MKTLKARENTAKAVGELTQEFVWDHREENENIYKNELRVSRQNGFVEYIPIMVSDKDFPVHVRNQGKFVKAIGIVDTEELDHNNCYLHADEIILVSRRSEQRYNNQVYLEGYICTREEMLTTPSGEEIMNLRVAIDMAQKEIYLPCVAWGENALYVNTLSPRAKVQIVGKIGYRKYFQGQGRGPMVRRIISIYKISEKLDFYYEKIKM